MREVADLLSSFKQYIYSMVKHDPQYIVVKILVEKYGCSLTSLLVVANSLVSYQLTSRGEDYWIGFMKYMVNNNVDLQNMYEIHRDFLTKTSFNRIQLEPKIRRLEKFYRSVFSRQLYSNLPTYCGDLALFNKRLAETMGGNRFSKTIVFATKMMYYLCDICGYRVELSNDLPIPVDRRNAYLAVSSCMVKACSLREAGCVERLLSTYRELVMDAWSNVCRIIGVPCIVLDSFTWLVTGVYLDTNGLEKTVEILVDKYNIADYVKTRMLVEELFRCVE